MNKMTLPSQSPSQPERRLFLCVEFVLHNLMLKFFVVVDEFDGFWTAEEAGKICVVCTMNLVPFN